jgi:hypothetical protein
VDPIHHKIVLAATGEPREGEPPPRPVMMDDEVADADTDVADADADVNAADVDVEAADVDVGDPAMSDEGEPTATEE